jgi:hypothetical protein
MERQWHLIACLQQEETLNLKLRAEIDNRNLIFGSYFFETKRM